MKASTGPSVVYPSNTFGCRFLLCCVVLLSSVHGNTYQRDNESQLTTFNDAQRSWKNLSQILLSANADGENGRVLSSSQNDGEKSSLLLDENDIVHAEHFLNNEDDVTYSDEYEQELHRPSEPKTIKPKNVTLLHSEVASSPGTGGINTSLGELYGNGSYSEEYDTYYYYEDYDNDTSAGHNVNKNVDHSKDEIMRTNSAMEKANYSEFPNNFTDLELDDNVDTSSMESSEKHYVVTTKDSSELPEKSVLIGEAVVSVVTTKSVVNGTVSIPVTPLPQTTEQISSPPSSSELSDNKHLERHQTTENSIVLASVQTSRSISGARFLPFPVVEQVVQVAQNVNSNSKTPVPTESTESIIDKLDRVQSELSSGFLSGGFRNSGNTLQLDVLPEADQSKKSRTTTMKIPVISKFVPHRYNANRKPASSSRPPIIPTISRFNRNETRSNSTPATTVRTATNKPPQLRPPAERTSIGGSKGSPNRVKNVYVPDVSAFLPPGYNIEKAKSEPTEKSVIEDIFSKAKVDISQFLPPGFNSKESAVSDQKVNEPPPTQANIKKPQVDLTSLLPPGYKPKLNDEDTGNVTSSGKEPRIKDLFAVSKVDLSQLLPQGYNPKNVNDSEKPSEKKEPEKESNGQENATTEATVSTTKAAGIKLVFPSRPGGRKPIHRTTTPSGQRAHAPGGFKPSIQKGWPTRATTEFTGWPTSSTTPISIEKLLEAARTATPQSDGASITPTVGITTSTTTTTTTTTTPRPTTPGICEEECEVAGTIRLVGNTIWVPELLDRNTVEWKQLANEVENEIDLAFTKSGTLRKWYKKIRIDAFSQGSILVDYFVELNEIGKKVNTQELKSIFHDSLNVYTSNNDNSSESDDLLVLGAFTIDPASTDFVVIPKSISPPTYDNENTLMPQWAIAVIVIGVGGLLFIIIFGVSVLINRRNVVKVKPPMPIFDEEIEKNIIHRKQSLPERRSIDYPKEDFYDTEADWNDKSFDSTSNKMMVDGPYHDSSKYNLYDSWRSEWNGYYTNASHASNRSPGYESTTSMSRHRPNYDTNF